jgi:hypothetical protein
MLSLKYSTKCVQYVQTQLNHISPALNKENHPFLDHVWKILHDTYKTYTYTVETTFIPKLHNKNPIMYQILKDKCPKEVRFEVWMNEHFTNMNYMSIYSKATQYIKKNYGESICKQRHTINTVLYQNLFISLDCQQYMETYDLYEFVYKFTELGITIYLYNRLKTHNIDVQNIVHLVQTIRQLKQKNEPIKIYILCTEQKKILFDEFTGLGPVHVNSGMSMDHTMICVWRIEELFKVLIHELIHYHQLDFRNDSIEYDEYDQKIRQILNYKGTNYLFEAYTDFLAIVIHSMWLTYWIEDRYLESFYDILNNEIRFQQLQNKKILQFYKIDYLGQKKINTYTSVISYYFIKNKLFYYFFDIITKLHQNVHIDSIYILKLIYDCACQLKKDNFNQIRFVQDRNSFIMKTMRMSAYSP